MEIDNRPDGSTSTAIGWLLVAIGVVAAFFIGNAESMGGMIFAAALTNLGIGLGVLLLSLGYLVRAIWFLPGRDAAVQISANVPASQLTETQCNWCERVLPAGKTTCTSLTTVQLAKVANKVKDPACLVQFEQRGILGEAQTG